MKRTEPQPLGKVIDFMLARAVSDPSTRKAYLIGLWPRVAGEHIGEYTSEVQLKGRTLHVYITSASLKEQLGYMRQALVRQFNIKAGENAIDNIILH